MGDQENKAKTGRPKKEIDATQVKQLARIGCTLPEMAAVLECSRATLMRRFATIIKEGQKHLKASLRRWQYTAAQGGNVTMQIWLGKQFLNQKEPEKALVHLEVEQHTHLTYIKGALTKAGDVDASGRIRPTINSGNGQQG